MKPWQSIVAHAGSGLISLGATLSLVFILLLGGQQWRARAQDDLLSVASELVALQALAQEQRANLSYVQRHRESYRRLLQIGFVGAPEREAWVEQLVTSARRTGLSSSLGYTLFASKPLSLPSTQVAAAVMGHEAQFHDLELALSPVHEEDLLGLLRDLDRHLEGRFRVNACQLSEPTRLGLTAHCVLRFFNLLPNAPVAMPTMAAAPASAAPSWPQLDPLFYAPAERKAMVLERSGDGVMEFSRQMRLSGIVQRDRRHGTAWINAQAVAEDHPLRVLTPPRISADAVVLDGQRLRVGETLDLATGARTDIVAPGALSVKAVK